MYILTSVLVRGIKGKNRAHSWRVLVQESSLPFSPKANIALAAAIIVEENYTHRAMLSRSRAAARTSCTEILNNWHLSLGCGCLCQRGLWLALAPPASSENKAHVL